MLQTRRTMYASCKKCFSFFVNDEIVGNMFNVRYFAYALRSKTSS